MEPPPGRNELALPAVLAHAAVPARAATERSPDPAVWIQLLSRRHVAEQGIEHLDIASPVVIATREDAHEFSRLYFRPRNPTQYHIEGVRRPEECVGQQAAMLVMIAFDAAAVLTREGVQFSNGNMQASSDRSRIGHDEEFFRGIDFELVYHEGPFDPQSPRGWDIRRARNAEVLAPSPLPLQGFMTSVVCRSAAERATLLHKLGNQASRWTERIRVEPLPGIFFREKAFVEAVEADFEGFTISFHPRKDNRPVRALVRVRDASGTIFFASEPRELDLSTRWRWACRFRPGIYVISIELDGVLAHEAPVLLDDSPF